MKKKIIFFAKCLVMLLLVVLFCFEIVMPQYSLNYQAVLIDKNERLCSIEGPKIVLVGNSNLAFGIDSAAIEEAFGMPKYSLTFVISLPSVIASISSAKDFASLVSTREAKVMLIG